MGLLALLSYSAPPPPPATRPPWHLYCACHTVSKTHLLSRPRPRGKASPSTITRHRINSPSTYPTITMTTLLSSLGDGSRARAFVSPFVELRAPAGRTSPPPTTFGLGNGNLLGPSNSTNGKTKARARDQSPNEERRVRLGSLLSLDMSMDC